MKRELWTDSRTSPRIRIAANAALREWARRRGESLRPASVSGLGTVFESDGYVLVGRTSDASSLKRNPGLVHWSSMTGKQYESVRERAERSGRSALLLLMSYTNEGMWCFEVPFDAFRWPSLPRKAKGDAFFKVSEGPSGRFLESQDGPVDVTDRAFLVRRSARQEADSRTPTDELLRRITIEPGKRSGKPCIRGLRITVDDILEYLAAGMTADEILSDFPVLERQDIAATLAFAARRERMLRSAS